MNIRAYKKTIVVLLAAEMAISPLFGNMTSVYADELTEEIFEEYVEDASPDIDPDVVSDFIEADTSSFVGNMKLDANGGSVKPDSVEMWLDPDGHYISFMNLPIPSRDGYVFDGWYIERDETRIKWNGSYPVSYKNEAALTAHWIKALEGSCGSGVYYDLSGTTLTISGRGNMRDIDRDKGESWPWDKYMGIISDIIIEEGIKHVGDWAFQYDNQKCIDLNHDYVKEIIIPSSVKSIGKRAFSGGLSITKVIVKGNLDYIDDEAFAYLEELQYIDLSAGVKRIGKGAFKQDYDLAMANYEYYGVGPGLKCINLPDNIEEIGEEAFYSCLALESITLPNSVKKIGNSAFKYTSLKSVALPTGLTELKDSSDVFGGCDKIRNMAVPNMTYFGNVFYPSQSLPRNTVTHSAFRSYYDTDGLIILNDGEYIAALNATKGMLSDTCFVIAKNGEAYSGLPVPTSLDTERTFLGWYTQRSGGDLVENGTTKVTASSDHTLYAHWSDDPEPVTPTPGPTGIPTPTPTDIPGQEDIEVIEADPRIIVVSQKIDLKDVFKEVTYPIAKYKLNDNKAAALSKSMLTGKKAGEVTVEAQTISGGKYVTAGVCDVAVLGKPKLKFGRYFTYEGQEFDGNEYFIAEGMVPDAVTLWESSKPAVVKVTDEKEGTFEIVAPGSAKITAYFGEKGKTGTVKVSASVTVKYPLFAKSEYTMQTGEKKTFSMKNVNGTLAPEWNGGDEDLLLLSGMENKNGASTGKVTVRALGAGETTLNSIIDGKEYSTKIIIRKPEMSVAKLELIPGKSKALSLKFTKYKKSELQWSSEDEDIATVDKNGKVKAVGMGETVISVSTLDGIDLASCSVIIGEKK